MRWNDDIESVAIQSNKGTEKNKIKNNNNEINNAQRLFMHNQNCLKWFSKCRRTCENTLKCIAHHLVN